MTLKWDFLILNDALMSLFGFKQCLHEIFVVKRYSNRIKSLRFVHNHSAPFISFIFDLSGEKLDRTIRDLNRTRRGEQWTKWDLNKPRLSLKLCLAQAWFPALPDWWRSRGQRSPCRCGRWGPCLQQTSPSSPGADVMKLFTAVTYDFS